MRSSLSIRAQIKTHCVTILCLGPLLASGVLADPSSDVAPTPALATSAACTPAPVACDTPPPICEPDTVPEVEACLHGQCPGRCWTGRCVPCASECVSDDDCVLVGRHGCCGDAGDCENGCFWAASRARSASDPCYFEAVCPIPTEVPEGCPDKCEKSSHCGDCPHCKPEIARCEAGACTSAWPSCEPNCVCD
jgi:hypothetical protein